MNNEYNHHLELAILGGGISGLSTAYFASLNGITTTVFERNKRLGGNCITFHHGEFSYDSGAHRIHDKNPDATALSHRLLGDDLLAIDIPSRVFDDGHLVKFPFSFRNLLFHLGPLKIARGMGEILSENLIRSGEESFEHSARRRYGKTVSERYLLNYTEKLWGLPCHRLSPELTGGRLKGLDIRRIMWDIFGVRSRRRDMEGAFYYPRNGIGMIHERLVAASKHAHFRTDSDVVAVYHEGRRITGIRTSSGEEYTFDHLVSTMPLSYLIEAMDPPVPAEVMTASENLSYRDLFLVAMFVDTPSVTDAATVYFPGREFPFTRVAEPGNRSSSMSPGGRTSLVAEIPFSGDDRWSEMDELSLAERVVSELTRIGWIHPSQLIGSEVRRLPHAYPVISMEAKQALEVIEEYIAGFINFRIIGRTGAYRYSWIHDHVADAKTAIEGIIRGRESSGGIDT